MPNLRAALNDYLHVATRIRDEFPDTEDTDLVDTITGETYLDSAIACTLREAEAVRAMSDGLGVLLEELKQRQARLQDRANKMRAWALWAAQEAGLRKIPAADFTAYIGVPKRGPVVITDEALIPPVFVNQRITYVPDRRAIGDAIVGGENVPGAELGNAVPFWTIRR